MIDLDLYMSLINGGVMLFCLAIGYIRLQYLKYQIDIYL